ncbi:MAG: SRPBCC domain-containing protein [Chlorobium sp.]|nr:MAG: SRPBCC domain-containing protein [Chlorobium sp.]
MRVFQTEIVIDAPAENVWEILARFGRYPLWNPFIRSIVSLAGPSEQLQISVKLRGMPKISFKAALTTFDEPRKIGWHAVFFLEGMFEAHHQFEIKPLSSTQSRVIQREEFSGWLTDAALLLLAGSFRKGYRDMNRALKKEVEKEQVIEQVIE